MRKSKAGATMPPNFKLDYKAVVIQTVWYGYQNQHRSNGTEPRVQESTHTYLGKSSTTKKPKNTWNGENQFHLCGEPQQKDKQK